MTWLFRGRRGHLHAIVWPGRALCGVRPGQAGWLGRTGKHRDRAARMDRCAQCAARVGAS